MAAQPRHHRSRQVRVAGGGRRAAVQAIAGGWPDDPGTLPLLRDRATTDHNEAVRQQAAQAIEQIAE
jgi:hypothetical protein